MTEKIKNNVLRLTGLEINVSLNDGFGHGEKPSILGESSLTPNHHRMSSRPSLTAIPECRLDTVVHL